MLHLLIAGLLFAVAIGSSVCATLTRPDRNYYPMQRVLWTILGFVFGSAGIGALIGAQGTSPPLVRIASDLLVLLGILYGIRFMRRRNSTPRFIPLDIAGQPQMVELVQLRGEFERTTSYLRHGAMPADWVAELDEGRTRWQEFEDWRKELAADTARRKARRGIE